MELPSKELLSEIHNLEVLSEPMELTNISTLTYLTVDGMANMINIYELMHLMKKWLINKGLKITIVYSNEWTILVSNHNLVTYVNEKAETEFEAVTKACELVFEQKESK